MPESTRPIRVAHITAVDGSLRYLLANQLRAIADAGYRVYGVSSTGPQVPFLREQGIEHVAVRIKRTIDPFSDLLAIIALVRFLRRERIDIVHTHTPKPGLLGQLSARLAGTPIIINTLHGFYFTKNTPWLKRQFFIAMEKIAGRCSDLVLSQNPEDIETAIAEKILPAERLRFLGNGIDLTRFSPAAIDPQRQAELRTTFGLTSGPVIGFLGRHLKEKGLLELFEALQTVRAKFPTLQLLSVGRFDNDRGDVISPATADAFGVREACHFVGMQEDVPHVLSLMDLLVLPSHREGFPRAPMEAAAMGIPTIVTDIRGCRETVVDGHNGLRVPVKDPTALASAIERFLADPEFATACGVNGLAKAAADFDERIVFQRVLMAYEDLLAKKRLRTGSCQIPNPSLAK